MPSSAVAGIGAAGVAAAGSFSASRTTFTACDAGARERRADRGEHADRGGAHRPQQEGASLDRAAPAVADARRGRHPDFACEVDRARARPGSRAMRRPSATAAVTPATTDGTQSSGPAFARVMAASTPTPPNDDHDRRGRTGGHFSSTRPATAATPTSTMPMPTSRAILSFVPNSAIAASFAHVGARSIRAEPITANGLAPGAMSAAVSSPSPAPSTAAATPAPAAAIR